METGDGGTINVHAVESRRLDACLALTPMESAAWRVDADEGVVLLSWAGSRSFVGGYDDRAKSEDEVLEVLERVVGGDVVDQLRSVLKG